jgi:arginine-tRNA-protein transferase
MAARWFSLVCVWIIATVPLEWSEVTISGTFRRPELLVAMQSLFRYVAPPSTCGYLPDQQWSLEYEMVASLTGEEYLARMLQGWRRFGGMLFRPRCQSCQACQSLRVDVARFRPNRSQRRVARTNEGQVQMRIGKPTVSRAKLQLYDRYHEFQSDLKGWPQHPAKDPASYRESFVHNPPFTEEWCYYIDSQLVGVGYVDDLARGMSAIYFFYDPAYRQRSLGIWNVLVLLDEAARRGHPYAYLGYFVPGCRSLEYKAAFKPNQILYPDGRWLDHFGFDRE